MKGCILIKCKWSQKSKVNQDTKQRCEEKQSSCYRKELMKFILCGYFCFFYLTGSMLSAKFLLQMLKIIFVFISNFIMSSQIATGVIECRSKKSPYIRANLTHLISSELFLKRANHMGHFSSQTVIRK